MTTHHDEPAIPHDDDPDIQRAMLQAFRNAGHPITKADVRRALPAIAPAAIDRALAALVSRGAVRSTHLERRRDGSSLAIYVLRPENGAIRR